MRTLVWFRGKDLRVHDHGPLTSALETGEVIPLFVLDPYFFEGARARELPNRMQFLVESLAELQTEIAALGSRLVLVRGKSTEVVPRLAREWKVDRVVAQRWVEPFARERDRRVREALSVPLELFEGETILPPGTLRTGGGTPYAVFTPFSRAFAAALPAALTVLPKPRSLPPLPANIHVEEAPLPTCDDLGFSRNSALISGGETAGRARLASFVMKGCADYATLRDRMDLEGTSRLSADLKFGTVSPRTVWSAIGAGSVAERRLGAGSTPEAKGTSSAFLNELVWREFAHTTLWDRPELLKEPFRPGFSGFPWHFEERLWEAWVHGKTGYPIVDASARQLLHEGFVHNRARMISASFLTKHLLIHYQRGEAHYMKYLVDGDWAQNNSGWQWSAGCGCDAQPYFRVFNPVSQGEKFDPKGDYVRRWVPELSALPSEYLHAPWEAPPLALRAAGIVLGVTYPKPIVDHKTARERFLATAAKHLKGAPPTSG